MLVVKKIKNRGKRIISYVHGENVSRSARPYKPLTKMLNKRSGRMRRGKISVWQRGGGAKRRYRIVEMGQPKGEFIIERLERDPNRNCFVALVVDKDGKRYYVPATSDMKAKGTIQIGEKVEIREGNRTQLYRIPTGNFISNVELYPDSGGKIARGAGSYAVMMGVELGLAQLKMPSGEIRQINQNCWATIGQMSNPEHNAIRIGKAGRVRLMGRRPKVRGKAKNPVDHPHGGGEGNQPIGLKHPKTKSGKPALGVKTRRKNKYSNKFIIKPRKKKRR